MTDQTMAERKTPEQTTAGETGPANGWFTGVIALGLIAIGAAVRLRMYLANLSFWRDEAALALNITQRSFAGLFKPLDYYQAAAVGFLMIEKLAVTLFGAREFVLRFWPVVASILTLPLFYFLCRRLLGRGAAIVALAILALSCDQFFYWTEVKQYSTDVFISVGLLLLASRPVQFSNLKSALPLAISGAVAIWFSHPAIFVLSGVGAAAGITWVSQRPRRGTGRILFLAAVWAASFGADYFLSLRNLTHNDYLQNYWSEIENAYAPLSASLGSLIWYKRSFFDLFRFPFSSECEGLAGLVFLVGLVAVYRQNKSKFAILVVPMLAALGASALRKYPFDSRLILFIFPMTTIFVAAGLNFLWQGQFRIVGFFAVILLMISPVTRTLQTLKSPPKNCEMRDSMAFVAAHRLAGDAFYLYPTAKHGFDFYQTRFGLGGVPVVMGSPSAPSLKAYADEMSQFAGKRVWVLIENAASGDPASEGQFANKQPMVLDVLDGMGPCVWKAQPFNEYAACYDLTGVKNSSVQNPAKLRE